MPPPLLRDGLLNDGKMLWVDCEMTGLDYENDRLIEIAAIASDRFAEPLDEGVSFVIKTSREVLDAMGEWCTRQHGASGLTERCLAATQAMGEVESEVCAYVSKHFPDGRAIIAGSSVHADKAFIRKDMPRLHDLLHYRIIDVSVLRELGARWYPELRDRPDRHESDHRALSDIKQSMADLRHLRGSMFVPPS